MVFPILFHSSLPDQQLSHLRLLLPPALIPHAQQGSREAEAAVTEEVHHHRAAAKRKLQELRMDPGHWDEASKIGGVWTMKTVMTGGIKMI